MTQQTPQFAYAVIYEAFRMGATRKFTIMFKSDEQVSTGEQLQSLTEQVARSAVSNGQANSVDDVSIIGISLLNSDVAVSEQDASTMLAERYGEKADCKQEYLDNLEDAFLDISESLAVIILTTEKGDKVGKDAINNSKRLMDLHSFVYEICKNKHQ